LDEAEEAKYKLAEEENKDAGDKKKTQVPALSNKDTVEVKGDGDEGKEEEEEEPVFASAEELKKAEEEAEVMIPVDASDTPEQREEKKKAFIKQSKAMGFTFPGINPKAV
jgi:hypothetical protein